MCKKVFIYVSVERYIQRAEGPRKLLVLRLKTFRKPMGSGAGGKWQAELCSVSMQQDNHNGVYTDRNIKLGAN